MSSSTSTTAHPISTTYAVSACGPADYAAAFAIVADAFSTRHPFFNYAYPGHTTAAGRAVGAARFRAAAETDPTTRIVKCTASATVAATTANDSGSRGDAAAAAGTEGRPEERIIAVAKWNVYEGVRPDEVDLDGEFWDNDAESKAFAQLLFREFMIPRREALREAGGRLVCLDILAVDPKWHRKGAGRMLVKWGTAIADSMGVPAVVEASKEGYGLYASEGFQDKGKWETRLNEKFKGRETQSFFWMVRPVTKASS